MEYSEQPDEHRQERPASKRQIRVSLRVAGAFPAAKSLFFRDPKRTCYLESPLALGKTTTFRLFSNNLIGIILRDPSQKRCGLGIDPLRYSLG